MAAEVEDIGVGMGAIGVASVVVVGIFVDFWRRNSLEQAKGGSICYSEVPRPVMINAFEVDVRGRIGGNTIY